MDKLNLISVQDRLLKSNISIFSVRDFIRIFRVLPKTARSFLSYHSKNDLFARVRQGIYIANFNPPQKFEAANYLYKPSYISFESALSFYGVIPETIYTVTSATTKASKEFNLQSQSYQYNKIKKKLYFGYQPIKLRGRLVLMADKEKALLDYLYFHSLKKKHFLNERLSLNKIDRKKLGAYVNYFKKRIRKNKTLISLLETLTYDNPTVYKRVGH